MVVLAAACAEKPDTKPDLSAPAYGDGFDALWHDGNAELAGYTLTYPRYGELRTGKAVTIFVTEDFSDSVRVKADPGKHADLYPVLKLNLVRDFQTGIYDYNLMTSVFVALAAHNDRLSGSVTKVSFSSQEWCGNIYAQELFDSAKVRAVVHSYFDGEADNVHELDYPSRGFVSEGLWAWARGLAAPIVEVGGSRQVMLLDSLEDARLKHEPALWRAATLARLPERTQLEVHGVSYEVEVASAHVEGGNTLTFYVEVDSPHRIVRWMSSSGENADLLKSTRLQYWKMHDNDQAGALRALGF
ncbi:MAG: hypothetical protein H7Z43_14595 [Clostridia bacterium]|nr:hypothetical protein [Deltaproteobacteria bacterium]